MANEKFEKLWIETGAELLEDGIGYRLYQFNKVNSEDSAMYGLQLNITGKYSVYKQDGTEAKEYPSIIDDFAKEVLLILHRDNANV